MVSGPTAALDTSRSGVGMRAVRFIFRRHHQQAPGPKEGRHQDRAMLKGAAMAFQHPGYHVVSFMKVRVGFPQSSSQTCALLVTPGVLSAPQKACVSVGHSGARGTAGSLVIVVDTEARLDDHVAVVVLVLTVFINFRDTVLRVTRFSLFWFQLGVTEAARGHVI